MECCFFFLVGFLPLRDLWAKEQLNLTSADFVAAKKAATALQRKEKEKELLHNFGMKLSGKLQLWERLHMQIIDK